MQAEKEAQVGVDLSSLERVQREAAADRAHLEGELRRLRGEHSNLQVCEACAKYSNIPGHARRTRTRPLFIGVSFVIFLAIVSFAHQADSVQGEQQLVKAVMGSTSCSSDRMRTCRRNMSECRAACSSYRRARRLQVMPAAADDFDKQQAEALTQQVRWVLGRHAAWPKTHALPEQMDFSF